LVNETPLVAGNTLAFRKDGRELVVVVAKGTFVLAGGASEAGPSLSDAQVPLLTADVFGDDPATSAPRFENDFAPTKPECDVLLVGSAHSPEGRLVSSLGVGLRVGNLGKAFNETGPRHWAVGAAGGVIAGAPQPVATQPISYDLAFGGTEVDPEHPERTSTYFENPVGLGFRRHDFEIWGQPMPVTEESHASITDPRGSYRPMAFGPLGRTWRPRIDHVGTYDAHWMDHVAPFLPDDFNPLYFQAAPPDQRVPYPVGGEPIRLLNLVPAALSPTASIDTRVPTLRVGMIFVPQRGEPTWSEAVLDTIVLEPDANHFTCSWRASHAPTRDMFELSEVVIYLRDPRADVRMRARIGGKQYYPGLDALARARRGPGR
jgi:hypothetical protein